MSSKLPTFTIKCVKLKSNMFQLVKFIDNIYYICKSKNIKTLRHAESVVRWRDKKFYPAQILCSAEKYSTLANVCNNLNKSLPTILINKFQDNVPNATEEIICDFYVCAYCGILLTEVELNQHIKSIHDENFIIPTEERKLKRQYPTKQHFCLLCKTLQTKLARHLERQHVDEEKIQRIFSLKKGSLERKRLLANIQKEGDSIFNKEHRSPTKKILVRREFTRKKLTIVKVPCPYCKGLYTKNNLRNHVRIYHRAESENNDSKYKNVQLESRKVFLDLHKRASPLLKEKVFPPMRDDLITKSITQDELVITYANLLVIKYSSSSHHFKMIRQKIRHIARILLGVRDINPNIPDVASIFNPENFDTLIQAIHNLAGLKEGCFRAPSFGPSSVTLISHIGKILQTEAIKKKDEELETNVRRFLELLNTCANSLINKIAVENRTKNQRSKIVNLPKTEDVKKLIFLLDSDINKHTDLLNNSFSLISWINLNKSVLLKIMIFNRKRPGDVEKTEINEYRNLQKIDKDILNTLDGSKRNIAIHFGRYITRGKLNSPAPVLVGRLEMTAIELILKFRKQANVTHNNPFVFATPLGYNSPYFQAGKALEYFCDSNGLANKNLTATNLRKHLATVTSTMGKYDQNIISDFMGHALTIHNKIYKQRSVYEDIVRMGELLSGALECSNSNAQSPEYLQQINNLSVNADVNSLEVSVAGSSNNADVNSLELNVAGSLNSADLNSLEVNVAGSSNDEEVNFSEVNVASVSNQHTYNFCSPVSKTNDSGSEEEYRYPSDSKDTSDSDEGYCSKRKGISKLSKGRFVKNRVAWATPERKVVRRRFKDCLNNLEDLPSLGQCQKFVSENTELGSRTASQLRAWLIAEKKRQISDSNKSRWCTPNKAVCRDIFKKFYRSGEYPSTTEMSEAIQAHDELSHTSIAKLRSHLQHDFKYMKKRKLF